jgi:hypothetical protein
MTALTDEVRAAPIVGRLGHLVTINSDGGPQVSAVWIGLDGHKITTSPVTRASRRGVLVCQSRRSQT